MVSEQERLDAVLEEALASKRDGKYYTMPDDITATEAKAVWGKVFDKLRKEQS